jgi:DNA-binding GntR family transcriptional regulator
MPPGKNGEEALITTAPQPLVPDDAPALDVAKVLGEDIIFGRLAPGTRLVEDHLIARFGATRHYIRQALYELERTWP